MKIYGWETPLTGYLNENLHSHNRSEMLEVRCQKTKSVVVIPLPQVTKSVLNKYGGSLPPSQNEQVTNRNVKALGRLCGIDGNIVVDHKWRTYHGL